MHPRLCQTLQDFIHPFQKIELSAKYNLGVMDLIQSK